MNMTELHIAALNSDLKEVERLIGARADVRAADTLKRLPIHVCLLVGPNPSDKLKAQKAEIFMALFAKDPESVLCQDQEGNNIFHRLVSGGYPTLLDEVLKKPELLEGVFTKNYLGQYPIHTAILNGDLACVESLLKLEKVTTLPDSNDRLPLHYVAMNDCSEPLIEACCRATPKSNRNALDCEGKTPADLAIQYHKTSAELVFQRHGLINSQMQP